MDHDQLVAEGVAACNEVIPPDWWTEGAVTAILNRVEPVIRARTIAVVGAEWLTKVANLEARIRGEITREIDWEVGHSHGCEALNASPADQSNCDCPKGHALRIAGNAG